MKDLSTLAKLLAEEDINVIHRHQPTAMFDVLNRELSLPIWKEMSKNVQDLMTVHQLYLILIMQPHQNFLIYQHQLCYHLQ